MIFGQKVLGLLLCLEGLFNGLVGVNDEGNDNVDEDEVGHLHEADKVEQHTGVLLVLIDQLPHVDDLLPIVLPHHAKQRVQRHDVVVEVQIQPGLVHPC